ncbi:MAG: VOC family protein [Gordonia sp. (in: high G+C Gram-positive bacteria)]|uniref:VOC family protein n=1 Tax=Gordonia sp. (in: high G+C Gram-positive bacteria) TaxID=84139 RepID=UPI0039E6259F
MLDTSEVMAFVATTKPAESREFYSRLGLRLIEESDFAIVFDAHGTMLRIQKVESLDPPPFTVLGWRVDDIAAAIAELADAGVEMTRYPGMDQDDLGVWHAPSGGLIAWFADPDGNTLSLAQL